MGAIFKTASWGFIEILLKDALPQHILNKLSKKFRCLKRGDFLSALFLWNSL